MSTNLKPSMRSTNPYLSEIDRLYVLIQNMAGGGTSSIVQLQGTGGGTLTDVDFNLYKSGNIVSISRTTNIDFEVVSGAQVLTFSPIPEEYRPTNVVHFLVHANPNTANTAEVTLPVIVYPDGSITVNNMSTSRFFNLGNDVRLFPFCLSYAVV